MKRVVQVMIILWMCAIGLHARAEDIQIGDSLEKVISVLGPAPGEVDTGAKVYLYYDRGRVELRDGKVVAFDLMSREEAEAQRIRRQAAAEQAQKAEAARLAQRKAEGQELLERKLSDPAFLSAPPRYRLAFWEEFMRNYPGIPVQAEYNATLNEVRAEDAARQAEANHAEQMADMQRPLDDAQRRVYETQTYEPYWPVYSYHPPLIITQPNRYDRKDRHDRRVYGGSYYPSHSYRPHHDRGRRDQHPHQHPRYEQHRRDHHPSRSPPSVTQQKPRTKTFDPPVSRIPPIKEWPKVPTPLLDRDSKHHPPMRPAPPPPRSHGHDSKERGKK